MAATAALVSMAPVEADQVAMQDALNRWQQRVSEYEAALSVARTEEQRAAIAEPDGADVAAALWKSISTKTGERDEMVEPSAEERMQGAKAEVRKVSTYAFEDAWAAPAVFWFINRPQQLARLFEGKPRQLSFYADSLLKSIDKRHYNSPYIAGVCAKLAESPSVRVYKILEKAYTRNQDATARGCAALAMSIMLTNPTIAAAEGSETVARGKRIFFLKLALTLTPEKARFGNATVSEVATELAYVMRHLSEVSVKDRYQIVDPFLLCFAQSIGGNGEGVGDTVTAVLISELCNGVKGGESAALLSVVHGVCAGGKGCAGGSAVGGRSRVLSVHNV